MADNYIQRGRVIDVLLTADTTSGSPIAVGSMLGVPQIDGIVDDVVPCGVMGVYLLPLASGGADLAIGTSVNLVAATGEVTGVTSATSGDINGVGVVACNGALGADTHIEVLLTPGTGTVVP